jgi:hypothetical protein
MKRIALFLALATLVFAGCQKEDFTNYPGELTSKKLPKTPSITKSTPVEVPQSLLISSNSYAQQAVGYINMANSMSAFSSFLTPPEDAQMSKSATGVNSETYTWSYSGLTVTWIYNETATHYTWDIYMDGTYYTGGDFTNELYFHAEEAIDGKSGSMAYYDIFTGAGTMTWDWYYDSNDVFHYNYVFSEFKLEIVVNPDGSGYVNYFIDTDSNSILELTYNYSWNADGTGSWIYYNADGTVSAEGTW